MPISGNNNPSAASDETIVLISGIGLFIMLVGYMIPTMVAFIRAHPQKWPILLGNVFLGWTIIVWTALLVYSVWSFDKEEKQ